MIILSGPLSGPLIEMATDDQKILTFAMERSGSHQVLRSLLYQGFNEKFSLACLAIAIRYLSSEKSFARKINIANID
ncbi:MAG: hypothetical protein HQM08_17755 [Candidatus Riflebacteria bacterium]|nr:hypothetical protein [Candidatus Riflebacteria bacterium]